MSARQELTNTAELVLYGRMWRVLVQYEETTALDVSNLRTVFEIKKNALGQPSIAHIVIYNLAPDTEAQIIKEGFHIQLEAGYAAQYGLIFDGDIIQVFRNRENGINYRLEIIAADGKSFYGGNFVRTTLAAGSKPRDVIEAAAKLAYYPIEIEHVSENLPETTLPRGKVCFGYPADILDDQARTTDSFVQVDNGKLEVRKYTDPIPDDKCLYLTPQTGLVGTPEYTDDGIGIRMLLNPVVTIHGLIKIDNDIIQRTAVDTEQMMKPNMSPAGGKVADQNTRFDPTGEYEVYSLVHSGDTHGETWLTEIVGIGRNGKAGLPIMVDSAEGTVRS